MHVSLAGTRAVLRENDAFPTLLISNAAIAASMGQPGQEAEPRQRLENELRDKLSQAFQIETLVFHPPQTKQCSFGSRRLAGTSRWRMSSCERRTRRSTGFRPPSSTSNSPTATGKSVFPSAGKLSCSTPWAKSPPLRPSREVKVRQLLDDREIAKGNVRLEVVATARGLVPELAELLKDPAQVPGFHPKQSLEQGLSVTSLDAAEEVEALTERRWLIELTPTSMRRRIPSIFLLPPTPLMPSLTRSTTMPILSIRRL